MALRFVQQLLATYPIISDQVDKKELEVVLRDCEAALKEIDGDIVEFGCYEGTASLFLARLLREIAPQRRLHVYDSFAGLPEKTARDGSPAGGQFQPGELKASKGALVRHFKQAGLPLPIIHKGWFSDFSEQDVPESIAFAFLDGDYYQSITDSLRLVWPRLAPGARIVVDDYQSEALPGAKRAVDDWLAGRRADVRVEASLAIITLP